MKMSSLHREIKNKLVKFIEEYKTTHPDSSSPPNIDICIFAFKGEYSEEEIRNGLDDLVDSGIISIYSFHGYLGLAISSTEKFISSFEEE